jgi:hypothetical protein
MQIMYYQSQELEDFTKDQTSRLWVYYDVTEIRDAR